MRSSTWSGQRIWFSVLACFVIALPQARGQRAGSASSAGSTSNGTGLGSSNRSNTSNFPSTTNNNPSLPGVWQNSGAIFLSGRVMFDDGMKANSDIRIERVCAGSSRLEAHTDSRGQFSFQVGQNALVDTDASSQGSGGYDGYGRTNGSGTGSSVPRSLGGTSNNPTNPLQGCELRASYPGYRSDVLELGHHRATDDPNVGTLILHRLGGATAGTISLTTALVPKKAQKDYEKGVQLAEKGKFEDAEKHFSDAAAEYPKYAIAWFALGQLQQRDGSTEAAKKSFETAIEADSKYASPYDQLALLSAQGQDWEGAANYSGQAIAIDSVDYPSSFWYNALANYHLKKVAEAEKSLQRLLQLDKVHHYPQAENMYAQLLLSKGDYAEAATHLRAFLAVAPNAKDAAAAKEQLARLAQAKPAP